jgi:hypothetical protein
MMTYFDFPVWDENSNGGYVAVVMSVYTVKYGIPNNFSIAKIGTTPGSEWFLELPEEEQKNKIKFWWENKTGSYVTEPELFLERANKPWAVKRTATPMWVKYGWDAKPGKGGF